MVSWIKIKLSFENIKYGISPQNYYFYDLPIEYKQRLPTKRPIDCLNDKIVESLKVNTIKILLDIRIYKSSPGNADFDDLPFDGDERLITRRQLYHINDNIIFRLVNGSIFYT